MLRSNRKVFVGVKPKPGRCKSAKVHKSQKKREIVENVLDVHAHKFTSIHSNRSYKMSRSRYQNASLQLSGAS